MPPTAGELSQVLADWRGDAAVLRRAGHAADAERLERMADQVSSTAAPYLTWLSETDAMLRSGRTREWLRGRFAGWEAEGHARLANRERQYRELIIPRRPEITSAHEAGRQAARARRPAA